MAVTEEEGKRPTGNIKNGSSIHFRTEVPSTDIVFTDVTSTVGRNCNIFSKIFSKNVKEILHSVSGKFRSGELTAIMGPSGAGKSSLLNILAGYKKNGFTGKVMFNEQERCATERSCYIMQEDNLHPLLTVKEIMNMAGTLKLGLHHTANFRSIRITKILESLGLLASLDTMTGKLSGGQKKRLVIALELIDNPPVMFFDEPTSGLDSSTTKQCISLLKELSFDGRAIICTVHQPSALVFEMFDHLYCLSDGKCCYSGSPNLMKNFLSRLGLVCPEYHNPADFLIEICCGEYGEHGKVLVDASRNGKCNDWRSISSCSNAFLPTVGTKEITPVRTFLLPSADEEIAKLQTEYTKFHLSFCGQVAILVKRTCLTLVRDKFHMYCRLVMHFAIGLLIGIFFIGIGNDAGRVFNNFSLLFFSTIFQAFAALQSMIISFPLEVPVIRREYFNRWYSIRAYYLANSIADFPVQVGCSVLYCSVVYWMSGQPHEWYRFFMFMFICAIVALLAQSMGYLIGCCMKVMNGVVFGPLAIMPWVMMSGYFIQMRDSPSWSRPFFKISYFRHGLEGLATTIYGYSRPSLPCVSEDYCHFVSPKKFLKELDMTDISYLCNVSVILGIYAIIKFLTYFVLIYQLRHKR